MYEDIITVSTVTLKPMWGQKEKNLNCIMGYMKAAAKKGSDLVVFPEMALTAYDDEPEKPLAEKMQYKLAETVPGPSTDAIAELAKKLGLYVVMGMPIKDATRPDTIYNGLAIFTPRRPRRRLPQDAPARPRAQLGHARRCALHPRHSLGSRRLRHLL